MWKVFSNLLVRGVLLLMLSSIGLSSQAAALDDALHALRITIPRQRLPAPDFSLSGLSGQALRLSDYRGKVVLLNFWASFCAPCREEMPALQALWQAYREQGLVVLAIAADRGSVDSVRRFISTGHYDFPIPLDPDGVVRRQYAVMALPTTYLIAGDGRISGRALGARDWNSAQGRDLVKMLLRQVEQKAE